VLRDLKRRDMQAPVLAAGDGARLLEGGAGGVACDARTLTMAFKLLMLAQERWRSSRVPLCYR
jgi:hypothetical protein